MTKDTEFLAHVKKMAELDPESNPHINDFYARFQVELERLYEIEWMYNDLCD